MKQKWTNVGNCWIVFWKCSDCFLLFLTNRKNEKVGNCLENGGHCWYLFWTCLIYFGKVLKTLENVWTCWEKIENVEKQMFGKLIKI